MFQWQRAISIGIWTLLGALPLSAQQPQTVYYNGKVLTVDEKFSIAGAIAVKDGRIVSVGDAAEVKKLAGSETKLVDLQGKTVIPGLIDNHMHFMRDALRWYNQARIDGVTSRKQALEIIAAKTRSVKPGQAVFIFGGWSEDQFADQPGAFTKQELDRAAPRNPVIIAKSYMSVYLNSAAEKALGAGGESSGGSGGNRKGKKSGGGSRGESGGSRDVIARASSQLLPKFSDSENLQQVKSFIAALNAMGLTTVYDVGRENEGNMDYVVALAQKGELTLRAFNTLRYSANNPSQTSSAVASIQQARPLTAGDWHGVIGIGEHTYSPIHDSTMRQPDYSQQEYDQFEKLARAAAAGGWNIQEHAMQDATISRFLDIFEKIAAGHPLPRWTLAHCNTISAANLQRAKKLGMTIALHNGTVKPAGRSGDSPPVKMIQDSGIIWGLGSDSGVVAPFNPFSTLWWVVAGKIYPDRQALQNPISRQQALIAHTRSNAYLLFKEKDLGSLESGKFADFVVLDRDYLTIPADEIRNLKPVMTVVGGKIVYQSKN